MRAVNTPPLPHSRASSPTRRLSPEKGGECQRTPSAPRLRAPSSPRLRGGHGYLPCSSVFVRCWSWQRADTVKFRALPCSSDAGPGNGQTRLFSVLFRVLPMQVLATDSAETVHFCTLSLQVCSRCSRCLCRVFLYKSLKTPVKPLVLHVLHVLHYFFRFLREI